MSYQSNYHLWFNNDGLSVALPCQLPWQHCHYYPNGMSSVRNYTLADHFQAYIQVHFKRLEKSQIITSFSRRQQTGFAALLSNSVGSLFMSSSELVLQALTVFPLTKQHIHRDLMTQKESEAKHIHHDSKVEAIQMTGVSGEESHGL